MNKTNIEWCDMTYNPVTGCLHKCEYCYAKQRTRRFQGYVRDGEITTYNPAGGAAVLTEPLMTEDQFGKPRKAAFPYGFDPTFHKYRLNDPKKTKTPQNIFVGSMCDLFGKWVPDEWIVEVFDSCLAAPQHKYLFLTKNPIRYSHLDYHGLLPKKDNFWYGCTVTDNNSLRTGTDLYELSPHGFNTFMSIEPLLGPVDFGMMPEWVIIGAETGDRHGKIVPQISWIKKIVSAADTAGVPIFMKDNLKPVLLKGVEDGLWADGFSAEYPCKLKQP